MVQDSTSVASGTSTSRRKKGLEFRSEHPTTDVAGFFGQPGLPFQARQPIVSDKKSAKPKATKKSATRTKTECKTENEGSKICSVDGTVMMDVDDSVDHVLPGYFEILQEFSPQYPRRTNVFCWWCCHPFKTCPIGMPKKFDSIKERYEVVGCFCSFACVIAYMKDQSSTSKYNYSIIASFYKMLTDDKTRQLFKTPLEAAPSRFTLQIFGGVLTIDQFRHASKEGVKYDILHAPQVPSRMFADMQESTRVKKKLEIQMEDSTTSKKAKVFFTSKLRRTPNAVAETENEASVTA